MDRRFPIDFDSLPLMTVWYTISFSMVYSIIRNIYTICHIADCFYFCNKAWCMISYLIRGIKIPAMTWVCDGIGEVKLRSDLRKHFIFVNHITVSNIGYHILLMCKHLMANMDMKHSVVGLHCCFNVSLVMWYLALRIAHTFIALIVWMMEGETIDLRG